MARLIAAQRIGNCGMLVVSGRRALSLEYEYAKGNKGVKQDLKEIKEARRARIHEREKIERKITRLEAKREEMLKRAARAEGQAESPENDAAAE